MVRGLLGRGFRILAARAVLVPLPSGRGAGFLITFLPAAVPATPGSTARAVADGRGLAAQRALPIRSGLPGALRPWERRPLCSTVRPWGGSGRVAP